MVPQIDEAYRSRAEIIRRYANQVGLEVKIPAKRRKDIGDEYAFFHSHAGHVHAEFNFSNAFRWLLACREAKKNQGRGR